MDEDDVHFCMKCKSEIQGLEKYIQHRKEGCPGSAKASPVKSAKKDPQPTEAADGTAPTTDLVQGSSVTPSEEDAGSPEKRETRKRGRPRRKATTPKAKSVYVDPDYLLEDAPISDPEATVSDPDAAAPKDPKPQGKRGRPKSSIKSASAVPITKKPKKSYKPKKRQILECDLCNFMTSTDKRLAAHTKSPMHQENVAREQGGDRIFKCMYCSESFCLDRALRSHSKVHSSKPFCHECNVYFGTKSQLTKHLMETGHQTKYTCDICSKEFPIEANLKVHMTVHADDKPYECAQCSFKTKRKADLNIHVKRHMGIKPFQCTLCPFKSVKRSVLKRHLETHKERPRDLICEICGAAYCSKMVLQHHIFTQHQNGRRYPCDYEGCTYIFCYKSELAAHKRSHTKEKPYLCSTCGYEGSNTYALTKHTRIHTKEKPFVCPFPSCKYASRFSAHLVRHKRLHTGEKPYKCPFCNYRCNAQENLRKHIRNTKKHQGKDMYSCSKCEPGAFTTNDYKDLVHHTRSKHGNEYVKLQDVSRNCGIFQPGVTGNADNENIVAQALAESMVNGAVAEDGVGDGGNGGGGEVQEGKDVATAGEGGKVALEESSREEPELVIDHQASDIIQHALAQASKQQGEQRQQYQLQANPQEAGGYYVIGQVYGGGQAIVPQQQEMQIPQQIEIATTSGGASATQSVAEAMRCLAQGFSDQNQQVSFVVTNVVQKDVSMPGSVSVAPQQPQEVAIHAIPQTNGGATSQYSFYGARAPAPAGSEVPTPVQIFTSTTVPSHQGFAAVGPSGVDIKPAATITTASYQAEALASTSGQSMPPPAVGQGGDRSHLPFTQSLVQVVQRVRETTDEDTAVTILQEMDANADRILKKKSGGN